VKVIVTSVFVFLGLVQNQFKPDY